jgi:hypothetical protein
METRRSEMRIFDPKHSLYLLISVLTLLSTTPNVFSANETIYASYKYAMGDNDTKNDAKRICFLEAKRLAIEKAGTYIESATEIKNFQLTRDEIRTFAGAIIKVDIASEKIEFVGENPTIFMTVKAEVDIESFRERVKQIKGDRELERKIKDQQAQLQTMENKIKDLQKQLAAKDPEGAINVRRERKEAFDTIDELEKIKLDIRTKTRVAAQNVELGMTPEEVIRLLGEPRAISYPYGLRYNYGNVWIVFESGVVSCLIRAEYFEAWLERKDYRRENPKAIIK